MKKIIGVVSVLLVLGIAACNYVFEPNKSWVKIDIAEAGVCSGVHIGNGKILTAAHCTESPQPLSINEKKAELIWASKDYDVALLDLEDGSTLPSSFVSCDPLGIGDYVHAIGSPFGIVDINTWGKVAGEPRQMERWKEVIPLNLSAAPGSSGGPVYNEYGEVVALIVAGHVPFGNMMFAVPSTVICSIMGKDLPR